MEETKIKRKTPLKGIKETSPSTLSITPETFDTNTNICKTFVSNIPICF